MTALRLATRGSRLALHQSNLVRDFILTADPSLEVDFCEVTTTGDRQNEWSLENQGGTGLFTKELEQHILQGEADIAVHSSKDLPAQVVDGLSIAGYLPRAKAHDVLIIKEDLATPSTIATGSPRRREQLSARFPQAQWVEMRGNIETRLNKIRDGYADATVLAAAGLNRLGISRWESVTFQAIAIEEVVPAPGQGAIAVECRAGEEDRLPSSIFCAETYRTVSAEKRLMSLFGGGCHSCIGVHLATNRLLVFHEDCRFYEFRIDSEDKFDMEEQLTRIVKQLPLPVPSREQST